MFSVFFFNDTATTEIYTLSLHDALPISEPHAVLDAGRNAKPPLFDLRDPPATPAVLARDVDDPAPPAAGRARLGARHLAQERSEEHTSELQSRQYLVCRLLLEKKKNK